MIQCAVVINQTAIRDKNELKLSREFKNYSVCVDLDLYVDYNQMNYK